MKRGINALLLMLFVTNSTKKSHFSTQCYTKAAVTHVYTEDAGYLSTVETAFLNKSSSWCIPITLDNTNVMFKVDTGAEITDISQEAHKSLGRFAKLLEKPSKKLYGPACQPLNSLGQFSAKLTHGQNTSHQQGAFLW